MTKETFLSAFRALLTVAGSYLVGHSVFGHQLSNDLWQMIVGAFLTLGSTIWGIRDKPATIEGIQSAVRSVVLAIGGVLLALGVVTQQTLDSILALLLAIVPVIQSHTSKLKVKQIASGQLNVADNGKVQPAGPQIK